MNPKDLPSSNEFSEEWLSAYLDDELDKDQQDTVRQELSANPGLRGLLDDLNSTKRLIQQLPDWPSQLPRPDNWVARQSDRKPSWTDDLDDGLLEQPHSHSDSISEVGPAKTLWPAEVTQKEVTRENIPRIRILQLLALSACLAGIAIISSSLWMHFQTQNELSMQSPTSSPASEPGIGGPLETFSEGRNDSPMVAGSEFAASVSWHRTSQWSESGFRSQQLLDPRLRFPATSRPQDKRAAAFEARSAAPPEPMQLDAAPLAESPLGDSPQADSPQAESPSSQSSLAQSSSPALSSPALSPPELSPSKAQPPGAQPPGAQRALPPGALPSESLPADVPLMELTIDSQRIAEVQQYLSSIDWTPELPAALDTSQTLVLFLSQGELQRVVGGLTDRGLIEAGLEERRDAETATGGGGGGMGGIAETPSPTREGPRYILVLRVN
jgi:hypothetical protein